MLAGLLVTCSGFVHLPFPIDDVVALEAQVKQLNQTLALLSIEYADLQSQYVTLTTPPSPPPAPAPPNPPPATIFSDDFSGETSGYKGTAFSGLQKWIYRQYDGRGGGGGYEYAIADWEDTTAGSITTLTNLVTSSMTVYAERPSDTFGLSSTNKFIAGEHSGASVSTIDGTFTTPITVEWTISSGLCQFMRLFEPSAYQADGYVTNSANSPRSIGVYLWPANTWDIGSELGSITKLAQGDCSDSWYSCGSTGSSSSSPLKFYKVRVTMDDTSPQNLHAYVQNPTTGAWAEKIHAQWGTKAYGSGTSREAGHIGFGECHTNRWGLAKMQAWDYVKSVTDA